MKIADIEVFDLVIPHEVECCPPWAPGRVETARNFTLAIVRTDSGMFGVAGGNGHSADLINRAVKPYWIGQDPFLVENHLRCLKNAPGTWFMELALWDIIGKTAGMPLYQLWGAARETVPAYASTCELGTPEERAEQALRYLREGFKALKIRLHAQTMAEDLAYVDAVADAVGGHMNIMVDANQATLTLPSPLEGPIWDYRRALLTARELEDRGVVWLEEPLGRWDLEGLARLTRNTDIYIAGGEKNAALHEFRWMLQKGAYDIIQPDVTMAMSLSQAMKVKALCEASNVHFVPHHGVSAIGLSATINLVCTYAGWTYIEYMYDPPYRTIDTYQCLGGIITTPINIDENGCVSPPPRAGLGIEIDMSAIGEYTA